MNLLKENSTLVREKRLLITSSVMPILFTFILLFTWTIEVFRFSVALYFIYEFGNLFAWFMQVGLLLTSFFYAGQIWVNRKQFTRKYTIIVATLLSSFPIIYFAILLILKTV